MDPTLLSLSSGGFVMVEHWTWVSIESTEMPQARFWIGLQVRELGVIGAIKGCDSENSRTAPLTPSQWSLLTLVLGPCWVCSKLAWRKFGATSPAGPVPCPHLTCQPTLWVGIPGSRSTFCPNSVHQHLPNLHPSQDPALCLVRVLLAEFRMLPFTPKQHSNDYDVLCSYWCL